MTSVVFVIPAHGRLAVSRLAFAGIRWTLDELADVVDARALVVADDENVDLAAEHGFETLLRPNDPLGRKWNDGYEHACRRLAADFVVSCGSDDWIHPDLIRAHLAEHDPAAKWQVLCSRRSAVVSPDGREAVTLTIDYPGGDGVRMIPRRVLERVKFRPTVDRRHKALDGGMTIALTAAGVRAEWVYTDLDPFHIVDFKSDESVTGYEKFPRCEHEPKRVRDPLARLAALYPAALVEQAVAFYDRAAVAA